MVRQQQGPVKVKRGVQMLPQELKMITQRGVGMLMLPQELKMITQLLRAVTGRLQQLPELRRSTGPLARENKALTTDSHLKV